MELQEIGDWLRQELETTSNLAGELRGLIRRGPRGHLAGWTKKTGDCFDRYAAVVLGRLDREQKAEITRPVVDARPALACHLEVLCNETRQLRRLFAELRTALDDLGATDNLLLRDWNRRVESLIELTDRHGRHERELLDVACKASDGQSATC